MFQIPAPMSGSILELLVEVGTSVTIGQELLVLESMKMEIPVESPQAGTVTELLVQPEDSVEEDQVVAFIED